MPVLINDEGAHDFSEENLPIIDVAGGIEDVLMTAPALAIPFANFADGRGFGIARALRRAGYQGRLRAVGYIIADQYAMARRVGFDEVVVDDALARRQDADQWLARANWRDYDYQKRLGQARP